MTIYDLKPAFQNLLRPVCRGLASAGVTANQVTLLALILSLLIGAVFALNTQAAWAALLIPVWLFLRMALNAIDGMLAREHDMESRLGAVLNEIGDVISDTALYLPFACVAGLSAPLVVAVVIAAILTEFAGLMGIQLGGSRRYDGPMGKSDRAFAFGLLGLLLALGVDITAWADFALGALLLLSLYTVINRSRKALLEAAD